MENAEEVRLLGAALPPRLDWSRGFNGVNIEWKMFPAREGAEQARAQTCPSYTPRSSIQHGGRLTRCHVTTLKHLPDARCGDRTTALKHKIVCV